MPLGVLPGPRAAERLLPLGISGTARSRATPRPSLGEAGTRLSLVYEHPAPRDEEPATRGKCASRRTSGSATFDRPAAPNRRNNADGFSGSGRRL